MVNVNRYSPIGDIFDDLFKGFVVRPVSRDAGAATEARQFRIDVSEQNGAYQILADLPGVKKEDIRISVDGDVVSISAETRNEKESKEGQRLVRSERYFGKYSRSFRLGQDLDEAAAQAKYADGVLELVLPKKAAPATRQISVQ